MPICQGPAITPHRLIATFRPKVPPYSAARTSAASLLAPYLFDGTLRGIAQTGMERLSALKDIPTVRESGFPDFHAPSFWGFYAPSKTPAAIVDRFVAELTAIINQPDVHTKLTTAMLLDVTLAGPTEFRAFFFEQVAKWRSVIRENNLQHT